MLDLELLNDVIATAMINAQHVIENHSRVPFGDVINTRLAYIDGHEYHAITWIETTRWHFVLSKGWMTATFQKPDFDESSARREFDVRVQRLAYTHRLLGDVKQFVIDDRIFPWEDWLRHVETFVNARNSIQDNEIQFAIKVGHL